MCVVAEVLPACQGRPLRRRLAWSMITAMRQNAKIKCDFTHQQQQQHIMSDFRDQVCSSVLQDCLFKENTDKTFNTILTIFRHNELFGCQKSSGIQEVVSHIHSCLGSSKDRSEGLVLLNELVDQCSTEVFSSNAQTWFRLLIQTLQSHSPPPIQVAACQTLTNIIAHSKSLPDLAREITATYLPQLLPLLLNVTDELHPVLWTVLDDVRLGIMDSGYKTFLKTQNPGLEAMAAALRCVNSCIQNYPGPVGPFKNKLEALVVRELEKPSVSQEVYRSYGLVALCGGGGSQGVKYSEAWLGQCNKLLGSLDATLTQLYEGLEVADQRKKGRPTLSFNSVVSTPDRVTSLVARLKVLSECLHTLISTEIPVAVKLPVESILQMVVRCLAVNNTMLLSRPTTEHILLAVQLPTIHIAALGILKHLVYTCKTLLVPYCNRVMRLFSEELTWTHVAEVYGQDKPLSALRGAVYDTLTAWISALQSGSGLDTEQKVLVQEMLHDCAPHVDIVKMTSTQPSSNQPEAAPTQKKKKRGYQELSQGISSQRKVNRLANAETVVAALEAMYWAVTTSGSEMERKYLQDIQSFTVKTLLSVQQNSGDLAPIPYSDWRCRKGIYRLLVACTLTPHATAPPPVQCALGIISAGSQDTHVQVSSYCHEAMRICECLIHPRVPCLNGPIICQNIVTIGGATDGESAMFTSENENQSAQTINIQYRQSESNGQSNVSGMLVEDIGTIITSNDTASSLVSKSGLGSSEATSKKRSYETSMEADDDRQSGAKMVKLNPDHRHSGDNDTHSNTDTIQHVHDENITEDEPQLASSVAKSRDISPKLSSIVFEPQPGTSQDQPSGGILIVSDDEHVLVDSSNGSTDDDNDIENIDLEDSGEDIEDESKSNTVETIEIVNEDSNSNDVSIVEPKEMENDNDTRGAGENTEDMTVKEAAGEKESSNDTKAPSDDGVGSSEGTATDVDKATEKSEVEAMLMTFVDADPDSD